MQYVTSAKDRPQLDRPLETQKFVSNPNESITWVTGRRERYEHLPRGLAIRVQGARLRDDCPAHYSARPVRVRIAAVAHHEAGYDGASS
jgi:hypothetical protein